MERVHMRSFLAFTCIIFVLPHVVHAGFETSEDALARLVAEGRKYVKRLTRPIYVYQFYREMLPPSFVRIGARTNLEGDG
jgi:hypothetical protein